MFVRRTRRVVNRLRITRAFVVSVTDSSHVRRASTSHTDHRPIKAMRLEKWDGKTWVLFGDLIEATGS